MTTFPRFILAVAACTGGMLFLGGCGVDMSAPTSYTPYHSQDGTFECDCPGGWTIKRRGKKLQYATFSRGNAEIHVETHVLGSAPVGQSNPNAAPPGVQTPDQSMTPLARLHDAQQRPFAERLTDYEELPATTVETGLGDARRSEFTMAERLGGRIHGYRVTLLADGKRVQIACLCPESNWPTLRPAFDHVIASFRRGHAKR